MTGTRSCPRQTQLAEGSSSKASDAQAVTATNGQGAQDGLPTDLQSPPPVGNAQSEEDQQDDPDGPPSPTFSQDSRDKEEREAEKALRGPTPVMANNASFSVNYPGGYTRDVNSSNRNPYESYQPGRHLTGFVSENVGAARGNNIRPEASSFTSNSAGGPLLPPIIMETNMNSGTSFSLAGLAMHSP